MTSKALRKKGDIQQGRAFAGRAMEIFSKYGYLDMVGQVYWELSRYYSNSESDLSSKIELNKQALAYFIRAGDKKKQGDILKEQGDLQQLLGNYRQALSDLQRALVIYRSINNPDLHGVYDLLGFVSTKMGDYKAGLGYGLQAVKTAQMQGDTGLYICTIYNRLGITYHALGQFDQADYYYKQSLHVAQKYNHIPSIIYLSGNISSILLSYGKSKEALNVLLKVSKKYPPTDFESRIILSSSLMNVYRNLKIYALAQPYLNQVLEISEKNGAGSPGMATTYQSIVQFLIASKQYEAARKYLGINHTLCQKQGSAGALAINHLLWFRLDSTLGSYSSAIVNYQRYVSIRDSLLTESKNHQIAQLDIQYQTERKDNELKLKEVNIQLLTEQGRLQQQKLDQAQLIRNGTVFGALMLVLLLGLGYNRYRLKQESNELLELKQLEINHKNYSLEQLLREKEGLLEEKEWMLKEIHHRVRNNLQIVISLLDSQAGYLSDSAALSTIKESQHRVQAMALIHQKLYQSEHVARVEMSSYINDLVVYLRDSYSELVSVRFNLSVEPLELDVTLAVPLGLIINEALTNSLKYAFSADQTGTITLILEASTSHTYLLSISDNGKGLPPGSDPISKQSLGMTLMYGLSKQLGGELTITGTSGVTIRLIFQDERLGSTYSSTDYSLRWNRPFSALSHNQRDEKAYNGWIYRK
jgi:two-component sensor histidine kinase